MTDHCAYPKCGKELTHKEGRKKKKYCNQNCNTRHWQMMNPAYKPKSKRVPLQEYSEMELAKIKLQKMMENPMGIFGGTGHKVDIEELRKMPIDMSQIGKFTLHREQKEASVINKEDLPELPKIDTSGIEARIKQLEHELKNPPKTAIIGVKNWIKARQKELSELKSKM